MYKYVVVIHILAATVWTGGHLVLALAFLPRILREGSVEGLQAFESAYEKWGMSALIIQVLSGLWLAWFRLPDVAAWFAADSFITRLILLKLVLLGLTLAVAVDARLRLPLAGLAPRALAWLVDAGVKGDPLIEPDISQAEVEGYLRDLAAAEPLIDLGVEEDAFTVRLGRVDEFRPSGQRPVGEVHRVGADRTALVEPDRHRCAGLVLENCTHATVPSIVFCGPVCRSRENNSPDGCPASRLRRK